MPKCHLSQEFLHRVLGSLPKKNVHYHDNELTGLLLEFRPTGTGTWYYRYYNAEKKTCYFRLGSTANMDAVAARESAYTLANLVRHGGDPRQKMEGAVPETTVLTVEQFALECYLPHMQLKKRSWKVDSRILHQYILPVFSKYILHSVKRIEVVTWQNTLPHKGEHGLTASSCNRIFAVMKGLFSSAVRWGFLDMKQNPCSNVSAFPEQTPSTRYLNKFEAWQVMTTLQSMKDNKNALALQLLLLTGARKQEILSARWEHTHLEERILTVPLSKSGKARHIPLSDDAVKLIQGIARSSSSPWLFPAHNPQKHIRHLYYTWDKVRQQLGLQDVRIHDLRHSFASLLVNAGCSLYEVQKILGHHDPKVTMRYAHLAQRSLVEAANCVGSSIQEIENRK